MHTAVFAGMPATLAAFLVFGGFGIAASIIVFIANKTLAVQEDPKVEKLMAALPGANCGGCGYPGCDAYARALAQGDAKVNLCAPGGPDVAAKLGEVLGVEAEAGEPKFAFIHCRANDDTRVKSAQYDGHQTCAAANLTAGPYGCVFGCLGLGDCTRACAFGAIELHNGLPEVDFDKCVGCGACVTACPRNIVQLHSFIEGKLTYVACSSKDPGKVVRKVCSVGCIGCSLCVKQGPEGVFSVDDNLSKVDFEKVDSKTKFKQAMDKCPTNVIVEITR